METYVPSLKVMFTLLMVQIYESEESEERMMFVLTSETLRGRVCSG